VTVVLAVFAVFVFSTLGSIDADRLASDTYPGLAEVVASVALTFFAFLGFSVITFSAGDLEEPPRQLPRAMYYAIGITTLTYVAISLGVFGVLDVDEVIAAGPTAIAEAARPALGDAGFALMSLTAMFATAGCTNASLYGATHLTEMLGTIRQFPPSFARETKRGRPGGLMITAISVLAMANGFDITAIASIGTAIALILFLALCGAGIRLRAETSAALVPMLAAMFAIIVVRVVFVVDTLQSEPGTAIAMVLIVALAVACNFAWKYRQGQQDAARNNRPGTLAR
jgi:amino acid transporter